ncbi:MAG: metalloregulator ArsR/SmtB family transcription factor [Planctomycetota bacterium]
MKQSLDILKALADETRLRVVMLLDGRELCLCQLVEVLDLAPSTVSKHLSVLHGAGLVRMRKQGRWHYYRRTVVSDLDDGVAGAVGSVGRAVEGLAYVDRLLADDARVAMDGDAVCGVEGVEVETLCGCYR